MPVEKIIQVRYVGKTRVVDIRVDHDSHVYYANGVATSNSHSVGYGIPSYISAYQKVHFPTEFYTAWLTYSDWKPKPKEEIYTLVQDAKLNGIEVLPPDIRFGNRDFAIQSDKRIRFGLVHIRGIGRTSADAIEKAKGTLNTWSGFLKTQLKRNVSEALIKSGALDAYGLDRLYMLKCYHLIYGYGNKEAENASPETQKLSNKELKYFIDNLSNHTTEDGKVKFGTIFQEILEKHICVPKRRTVIESKIKFLETQKCTDSNRQKSIWEKIYLGLNLSCSTADDVDKTDKNIQTVRTVYNYKGEQKSFQLHVVIDTIKTKKTKSGKTYAFIGVSDNSGAIEVICWNDQYEKYKADMIEGVVATLGVRLDNWNERRQFVLNKLEIVG